MGGGLATDAHQDIPTEVRRPRRAALEAVLSAWGEPVGARGRLLRIGALRTAVRDGPSDRQGSVDSTPFDWSSSPSCQVVRALEEGALTFEEGGVADILTVGEECLAFLRRPSRRSYCGARLLR